MKSFKANQRLARLARSISRWPWRSGIALGLLLGSGYLAARQARLQRPVAIEVNGLHFTHYTRSRSPELVYGELGVELAPSDILELPSEEELTGGAPIRLQIARTVRVYHERQVTELYLLGDSLEVALARAGLALSPGDEVWTVAGLLQDGQSLPDVPHPQRISLQAWIEQLRVPECITIRRAVRITVVDEGLPAVVATTADTVAEALSQASVVVYQGDRVVPALQSRVVPGLIVEIQRAVPITVEADGRIKTLRTRASSVGEVLGEIGIALEEQDRVTPAQDAPVTAGMAVSIVRVYEEYYVEEVPIGFETRWEPNAELEIDQRRTANWGKEGALRQQVRVHYENGLEVSREQGQSWVAREPEDRVIQYGTQIIVRQLDTPNGTIEYWRKIRMLATSYSAATAGTALTSSYYGLTRLGEPARKGIVAVDPAVIPMRQPVYVPGYGIGYAGDTGSAIKNRRIDLCYDDGNLEHWYRWVDVYLLTPVPPADRITWIIPNQPVERE